MRIASQIATILKLPILATGDAFSQVASQTVTNLINTDEIIHQQLIMRPLICFNKDEIIKWSKKIKTYQISILPFEDCCSLLVPKHPILNSELDKILTQEKSINKNINWEKILNFIVEQTITSLRE
jgi:thiamine biosynthesis protein ThiI